MSGPKAVQAWAVVDGAGTAHAIELEPPTKSMGGWPWCLVKHQPERYTVQPVTISASGEYEMPQWLATLLDELDAKYINPSEYDYGVNNAVAAIRSKAEHAAIAAAKLSQEERG